jgi:predicted glycosyl hydrolase (DUF1957 family)
MAIVIIPPLAGMIANQVVQNRARQLREQRNKLTERQDRDEMLRATFPPAYEERK